MLVALDKYNNRIYANSSERYKECYCPDCGESVIHKKGMHNKPYFAHKQDSACVYGLNKDNKSPWHIRMQNIFPPESLEVRFYDEETKELKYIADVFLKECNTVIEFQHSPISDVEFLGRTLFHLNAGRRIVWIFDESNDKNEFGRLKESEYGLSDWIHSNLEFDWPKSPRKMLNSLNVGHILDKYNNYSVCVYYGDGENTVHRIIAQNGGYKSITLSVHPIDLANNMNADDFFTPESYWLSLSPWKEKIIAFQEECQRRKRAEAERKAALAKAATQSFFEAASRRPRRRYRL